MCQKDTCVGAKASPPNFQEIVISSLAPVHPASGVTCVCVCGVCVWCVCVCVCVCVIMYVYDGTCV